jgi:isoprenylcysteine carboxyl methyltransferase (ICMT) family protein YpbQ
MAQDFNFACISVFRRLLAAAGAADKETRGQGAEEYGDKKVLAIHILHSLSPYLSFSAAA